MTDDKKEVIDAEVVTKDNADNNKNGPGSYDKSTTVNNKKGDTGSDSKQGKMDSKVDKKSPHEIESKDKKSDSSIALYLLWITWFISVAALSASLYYLYQRNGDKPDATAHKNAAPDYSEIMPRIDKKIEGELAKLKSKSSADTEQLNSVSKEIETIKAGLATADKNLLNLSSAIKAGLATADENFVNLNSAMESMDDRITEISTKLIKTDEHVAGIINSLKETENPGMDKARPFVMDAVRLVDLYGKYKEASKLLTDAASILDQENDPQNVEARSHLMTAATDLLAVKYPETEKIIRRIDQLNLDSKNLKLLSANLKPKVVKPEEPTTTLEKLGKDVWSDLKNLIKVSKDDKEGLTRLVSPEARAMSYMLVEMQLQKAQLEALLGKEELYQFALDSAQKLVTKMFVIKDQRTQKFVEDLESLRSLRVIADQVPESMTKIRKLAEVS